MKRKLLTMVLALGIIMLLVACGDNDEPTNIAQDDNETIETTSDSASDYDDIIENDFNTEYIMPSIEEAYFLFNGNRYYVGMTLNDVLSLGDFEIILIGVADISDLDLDAPYEFPGNRVPVSWLDESLRHDPPSANNNSPRTRIAHFNIQADTSVPARDLMVTGFNFNVLHLEFSSTWGINQNTTADDVIDLFDLSNRAEESDGYWSYMIQRRDDSDGAYIMIGSQRVVWLDEYFPLLTFRWDDDGVFRYFSIRYS